MNGISLTLSQAVCAVLLSAAVIFLTRLLPFVLFSRIKPPKFIGFIEKHSPLLIMTVLVLYCFKSSGIVHPAAADWALYAASAVCAVLHLVFRNTMASIIGSTVLYMVMVRIL